MPFSLLFLLLFLAPASASGGIQGQGFVDVSGWRLSVLFLLLVVLTVGWEEGSRRLEKLLKRRRNKALRHAFHHLQAQILVLGFLSLVLVAVEPLLIKICIPGGNTDVVLARADSSLLNALPPSVGTIEEIVKQQQGGDCPIGKQPLWSAQLINDTHLFLFILGVCYTVYACITLLLCIIKVRTWHKYEKAIKQEPGRRWPLEAELSSRDLRVCTFSWAWHCIKCFFQQFTESVNEGTFSAIRWLFIVKHDLPWGFDFLYYVTESMEEDIGKVLSTEWFLLLIAALILLIMRTQVELYILSGLSGAALFLVLIIGAKLESVAGVLARMSADYQDSKVSVEQYDVEENGHTVPRETVEAPAYRVSDSRVERMSEDFLRDNNIVHKLFWFGKPFVILRLFQLVFFVNSLDISIIILSAWRFPDFIMQNTGGIICLTASLVANFAVVVLAALYIIPEYALVSTCGEDFDPRMERRPPKEILRQYTRQNSRLSLDRAASGQPSSKGLSRETSVVR